MAIAYLLLHPLDLLVLKFAIAKYELSSEERLRANVGKQDWLFRAMFCGVSIQHAWRTRLEIY
ncbi:MAG: hypothetical protein KME46_24390 [Brasilonema angustatum HA4187-MV1]|nr:hypothetical protein [Brasilonema angustatum HA4187-MV1]